MLKAKMRLKKSAFSIGVLLFLAGCTSVKDDRVSVDYYTIHGNSTADLDKAIRAYGPKIDNGQHAVAVARIKMVPNITYSPLITTAAGERCSVQKAKVTVDAKVTLPRWSGRAKARGDLARAWDSMDRYTRAHEAHHVDIAFSYAKKIENAVQALPNNDTCNFLKLQARVLIDRLLKEHNEAQLAFDAAEQERFRKFAKRRKSNNS